MYKKILYLLVSVLSSLLFFEFSYWVAPNLNCAWLPWCTDGEDDLSNPKPPEKIEQNIWLDVISSLIAEVIKYIAVIAVLSLMISGIMYMVSWGDEEKTKRAKNWIIWSLLWVFLSISAFWIIKVINNLSIA